MRLAFVNCFRRLIQEKPCLNWCAGPDCIPACILKDCVSELAPILTIIFNKSLQEGRVGLLEDWRNANVAVIFKKGTRHDAAPVSKPISNHHRSDIVQISARYRKRHRTAYRFAHRLKVGPISWRLHMGPISGGYRFSHRTDILPSLDRYSVYRLDILYDIGPISFCPLASSRTDIDLYVFHSLLLQDHLGGFHLNGFTHKHG